MYVLNFGPIAAKFSFISSDTSPKIVIFSNVVISRNFKLTGVPIALVAISFFVVGFIYSQVPQIEMLIKLIAIFGVINAGLVYYLCKKIDCVSKR